MHRIIDVACRRTAGVAAGAILLGGMAGGVLLTPGTAFAAVGTTTAITGTTQAASQSGTTLTIQVSVTPDGGAAGLTGQVNVSDGAGGFCSVTLGATAPNGAAGGFCSIANLPDGSYTLTANFMGSGSFGPSGSLPDHIWIRNGFFHPNLRTNLNCTPFVGNGRNGSCTLWVTNRGFGPAQDVNAQIALPQQLRADFCGFFFGCSIFGNTAHENLGTLAPGQTKSLTVVFTARSGWFFWGWHHGHRITVRVVGSASAFNNKFFFGQGQSFSFAYVTIVPLGRWA